MTRILIHGAGRMARRVLAQLTDFEDFEPVGLVSRSQPDKDLGFDWFSSLDQLDAAADLLIDFTLPGGTRVASHWCASNSVALLSGTTGLQDGDIKALKNAALKVPVLWAPNMSHGVALMTALVRQAANTLGPDAKVAIADVHHRHKLDAPSGTALALAGAVREGQSARVQERLVSERPASIPVTPESEPVFSSVREGEVVGEHTVSFTLHDEVIEITHKALDRNVFAKGALKAGEWLLRQPPGYYSTRDWLGLH